jgi:hypothetical protein
MGRKKKYTPLQFRKAVTKYFRRRTWNEPQYYHDKVEDVYREILVKDEDTGEVKPMVLERYARPVSLAGLCNELKISKDTFNNYAKTEEYHDVCEEAIRKIEAFMTETIMEGKGSVAGIKFIMQNSFGMAEKIEVEQTGGSLTDRMKTAEAVIKMIHGEK